MADAGLEQQIQQFRLTLQSNVPDPGQFVLWGTNVFSDDEQAKVRSDVILMKYLSATGMDPPEALRRVLQSSSWGREHSVVGKSWSQEAFPSHRNFEGQSSCFIDFSSWKNNIQKSQIEEFWFVMMERFASWVELDPATNGRPTAVLIVRFTDELPYSWTVKLVNAIDTSLQYYPNLLVNEVYIGDWCNRLLCRFKGKKHVIPLNLAHWELFKRRRTVKVRCPQGARVNVNIYVVEWEVTLTAEFVPLRGLQPVEPHNYPSLMVRKTWIPKRDAGFVITTPLVEVPVDGNVVITVENVTSVPKKLVVVCQSNTIG